MPILLEIAGLTSMPLEKKVSHEHKNSTVNRGLTVSVNGNTATTTSKYNPGGLLPEVTAQSWSLFVTILAALLVLLALPFLAKYGLNAYKSFKQSSNKKGRVRFNEQAPASSTKGRVKMK